MNAIAYTEQSERVLTLSPGTRTAAKVRVHWIQAGRVHRSLASFLVRCSRRGPGPKAKVVFTDMQRRLRLFRNRALLLPSANSWVAKVWSFGRLAHGWNGSRAPAPTLPAVVHAARFVAALTEAGDQPTRVAPSAVGGVGITRRVGERKVLVEFFNDGSASALFADDATQQLQTLRVKTTPQGFLDLLGKMREYLDG
jgi:hypothetical protein